MKDLLKMLNPEQKKAVETLTGPVLVLAGPGTGKTHLLTTRIAYLLQAGIGADPENILCLTFTESGAVEMRDRLQKWIGNDAYKIKISTFHGFSEWIMTEYPQYFEDTRGERVVADDLQKALAFQQTVKAKKWNHFSNVWNEFTFQWSILAAISTLKRENISSDDLRSLIPEEQKRLESDESNFYKRKTGQFQAGDFKPSKRQEIDQKIEKMHELADFWDVYESKLSEAGYFDFDDQLMWTVRALQEQENLKLDLQERFQWVMVDEYQDTNSAQNAIVWSLTDHDSTPNVFAVGDDDQAIYRFQGASVENIFEFQKQFAFRTDVTLSQNYRSAQNILDAAFSVIGRNLDRVDPEKSLTAGGENNSYSGAITKAEFGSRYLEIGFLVDQIQKQLQSGVAPNDIAILVRKNAEVLEIAKELPKFGIPVAAQVFQNIFDHASVKQLILMLHIFADPSHDNQIMELLHVPFFEISGKRLLQFSLALHDQKKLSAMEFLIAESETNDELKKVLDLVVHARKHYWHCRPEVITEKLLYESGMGAYLSQLNQEETLDAWQNIRKFLEWMAEQRCEGLDEILKRIELHQQLHIAVRPDSLPADRRAVRIMTAHKSKGQEFEVVFLPGLQDRVWGNPRGMAGIALPHLFQEDHDENEDERRLFFVALTRARKELYLSYSQTDFAGRSKNPSIFWHEIPDEFCEILPIDETEESLQKLLPVFLAAPDAPALLESEKDVLREYVQKFVWSATSLQSFLDCPRKFLYQNLYRFPRKPLPQMALGTALHEALEKYMRQFKTKGILPEKSELLTQFDRALRGQNLEKEDFVKFQEHGRDILDRYFDEKHSTWNTDDLIEFSFGKFSPSIEGIRITGTMDKISFVDEAKTKAKIVDYKSGKPKPIKHGERLWRQLVFYDLLARHSKGVSWIVDSCELEFLTPDHAGKLGKRNLEVTEDDRAQVIQELKDAHAKLQNFEFPMVENPENDPEMDYWQNFGLLQ
jgi:DNA helicase-2/ATP-dependent DNA helicase PcrA